MKCIILFILALFVTAICFAQSNYTESLTVTTYYPSPYGVYRNLKLNPSDEPTGSAVSPGVMYFNRTDLNVYIYKNATLGWQPIGSSNADALVNFVHTRGDCSGAGGQVVDTDVAFKQCQFGTEAHPVSNCPTGWTQYKAFSTSVGNSCTGASDVHFGNHSACISVTAPVTCLYPAHPWGNVPTPVCRYCNGEPVACVPTTPPSLPDPMCAACPYFCSVEGGADCDLGNTQIGCY